VDRSRDRRLAAAVVTEQVVDLLQVRQPLAGGRISRDVGNLDLGDQAISPKYYYYPARDIFSRPVHDRRRTVTSPTS
jgi:hypothetical protein